MSQLLKMFSLLFLAVIAQGLEDGQRIRLCTTRQIELDKCNDIKKVLDENNANVRLECCRHSLDECITYVKNDKCDVVILESHDQKQAKDLGLKSLLWESYFDDNVIVAVGNKDLSLDDIHKGQLDFDLDDLRQVHAALLLNKIRKGKNTCERIHPVRGDRSIKLVSSKELLKDHDVQGKQLICNDLSRKQLNQYQNCNFDTGAVNGVFGRDNEQERRNLINLLNELVRELGPNGRLSNHLQLFGVYKNEKNVIFNDDVEKLETERKIRNGVDERTLSELLCNGDVIDARRN
jgi:hypothetical protein